MAVLPEQINERIMWFEQRINSWQASPALIGLTAAQCTSLKNAIVAARSAFDAAALARIASKNATIGQRTNVNAMTDLGSDALRFIKAFAESQPNPNAVYQAASVPPPLPPSPPGPPEPPTDVVGDPNADGTVTIRWKGSTANQTFFTIWRRVGNLPQWFQIGSVALKSFRDDTVPAGVPSVSYVIRAQRNNAVSAASDEATVNFGGAAMAA
ncbi:MAG: hypothetical protein HEQ23_13550 [Tepidisphaera sp.]